MIHLPCRVSGKFFKADSSSTVDTCIDSQDRYEVLGELGRGCFGKVRLALDRLSGEKVAIKSVLQDPQFKNRELSIMRELSHPHVVDLLNFYEVKVPGSCGMEVHMNLVMDVVPCNLHVHILKRSREGHALPIDNVRVLMWQLCRAVGYVHGLGVAHRDIKPQNLLVDERARFLKLCDFGTAKRVEAGESSISYVCSRFYRAPELLLGATQYTTKVDSWSIGCVLGEMLVGSPLFPGGTSEGQMKTITALLGSPSRSELSGMNPLSLQSPPSVRRPLPLEDALATRAREGNVSYRHCPQAVDLLSSLLRYHPVARAAPFDCLGHSFFDPLRSDPSLVNFTGAEKAMMGYSRLRAATGYSRS